MTETYLTKDEQAKLKLEEIPILSRKEITKFEFTKDSTIFLSDLTELKLIKLYYNVLELQNSLRISYKNSDSFDKLKSSKNLEEFELNLKNETYKLEEFKTTEDEFNKILKSNE